MGRVWVNMTKLFHNCGRNRTLEGCLGDNTVLCKVAFEEKLQKLRVVHLKVLLLLSSRDYDALAGKQKMLKLFFKNQC